MSRFTDRLDAITYAEHLLESAALPDHTIAVVTDVLRQRTLEYLNIDVADPPSRAIERLKKILGEDPKRDGIEGDKKNARRILLKYLGYALLLLIVTGSSCLIKFCWNIYLWWSTVVTTTLLNTVVLAALVKFAVYNPLWALEFLFGPERVGRWLASSDDELSGSDESFTTAPDTSPNAEP